MSKFHMRNCINILCDMNLIDLMENSDDMRSPMIMPKMSLEEGKKKIKKRYVYEWLTDELE